MPQGFRVCTADLLFNVTSVHHTGTGAGRFIRANPSVSLRAYRFPYPYSIAVGDLLPASAVPLELPAPVRRKRRKRIGE